MSVRSTMKLSALALLLVGVDACDRSLPYASAGTLLFEPEAVVGERDQFFATESQVLSSARLRQRVVERLGGPVKLDHPAKDPWRFEVKTEARGESRVLEVRVRAGEPQRAVTVCNALLQSYVDGRLEGELARAHQRSQAVAVEIDRLQNDPHAASQIVSLRKKLAEAELAIEMPKRDVRVLDACH